MELPKGMGPARKNNFSIVRNGTSRPNPVIVVPEKKQGATGITTVAPYIAGQWGRGNNRLFG